MDASQKDSVESVDPSGITPDGFSRVAEHVDEGIPANMRAVRPGVFTSRMKKRREFLATAATGLKAVASTLVVQGKRVREEGAQEGVEIRVGFTVTKKAGNAVVRNRIRRRLRAAVADNIRKYGAPGWDYVVIGRHTAFDAPYDIIVRDLRYALRKVVKKQNDAVSPNDATPQDKNT